MSKCQIFIKTINGKMRKILKGHIQMKKILRNNYWPNICHLQICQRGENWQGRVRVWSQQQRGAFCQHDSQADRQVETLLSTLYLAIKHFIFFEHYTCILGCWRWGWWWYLIWQGSYTNTAKSFANFNAILFKQ